MSNDIEYDKIKLLLDANVTILSGQIEKNRELMNVKLDALKQDTEEIKAHAKETNGQVKKNKEGITILEEQQKYETKRRKHLFAMSLTTLGSIISAFIAFIIHKITS